VFITSGAHNNTIGGTSAGDGNTIVFNGGEGVLVGTDSSFSQTTPAGDGNAIETNLIYANEGLNIHLGANGTPTINDEFGHTGINNNYQNTPVITSAVQSGSSVVISGSLTQAASPNKTYRIEFYANLPEGRTQFLGFITVNTNASGFASVNTTFQVTLPTGFVVTATATDSLGNTSEFYAPSRT
jgi:hypothetical protein